MSSRAWALRLEYDGEGFVGWQRQANGLSVQAALEDAAARLNGGDPVSSAAAGRTDAGVHASGQVAMLSLPAHHDAHAVLHGLNFHLRPHRVAVLRAMPAPEGFHPRFSAVGRRYRYVILNRAAPPALARHAWHIPHPLDSFAMAEAAASLLGRHDFTTFRAAACQAKSPVRTLDRLAVRRVRDRVVFDVRARSFLHHQVRNIVGTLALVGTGRWPISRVAEVLAARDRAAGGPTAPAAGLTLRGVRYPAGLDPFGPPHPGPLPQAGAGETRQKYPLPLAGEGEGEGLSTRTLSAPSKSARQGPSPSG